jgi:hypothetical protein
VSDLKARRTRIGSEKDRQIFQDFFLEIRIAKSFSRVYDTESLSLAGATSQRNVPPNNTALVGS